MEWEHMKEKIDVRNESPEKCMKNYIKFNIKTEFKNNISHQKKLQNSGHKFETQLILSRKLGHHDLIFNQFINQANTVRRKHLNFDDVFSKWKVQTQEASCYVCRKF